VKGRLEHREQITDAIEQGSATIAVHIRAGFAQSLKRGETATTQIIIDGTNSNTALIALGYVGQIAERFATEQQQSRMARTAPQMAASVPSVVVERRPWYNEDLQSRWYFVPGVIGNISMLIVVMLTAFAVVREREIGTLEQMMVTPIRRTEFILGKTVPFFLMGSFNITLVATVATLWFGIPFRGKFSVLALGAVLFLLCMLGVGLLISTACRTQQQAMVTAFFFLMPAIMFSGFGFPISTMPQWLQKVTYVDPLRYFLEVIRGVYLKGVGLDVLWPQMLAMAALAVFLLSFSILRFHKSLD
jgi:ABC-2 type transport system permease protein